VKKAKLTKKTKKLYEKPILTSEPIFETLALACTKAKAKENAGAGCTVISQQLS
jgi:hypothetical protein